MTSHNYLLTLSLLSVVLFLLPHIPSVYSTPSRSRNLRASGSLFPLIHERIPEPKRSRQTQCVLHKNLYNIGDTWHPNMSEDEDEPSGINYCLICRCLPRMKKNRVVAKTDCFNIGNKCPVPQCDDPILLPERCCKTCPGDTNSIEANFMKSKFTSEANNKKERNYYAILTDDHNNNNNTDSVQNDKKSFAYLQINRGHLLYIIESLNPVRPKYVRFYDRDNKMLEELLINGTTRDIDSFKIYGNWSRIPNDYRRMVRKGMMKISLAFNPSIEENVDEGDDDSEESVDEPEVMGIIHKFGPRALSLVSDRHTHFYNVLSARRPKLDNFLQTIIPPPLGLRSIANDEASAWNTIDTKCYYEARIFEEGAQWTNQNDQCEMCSCKRGRVECATEICMTLTCPQQVRIPGQCCPVCKYSEQQDVLATSNVTCLFSERRYFLGSKWHPYMPPKGFDQCTTCSCDGPNQVRCERLKCPPLNCHDSDAYYANEYDCCKRCPNKVYHSHTTSIMDQLQDAPFEDPVAIMKAKTQQQLLDGGCQVRDIVRANGEEWNPILGPLGPDVCVKCKCKDGRHSCVNLSLKCVTPVDCVPIRKQGECCLVCESESYTRDGRRGSGFSF